MKLLKTLFIAATIALTPLAFAAVDINTATQAELEVIKGVGPTTAKAIIDYRTKNGPFKSMDDVKKVKGIGGGKKFEAMKADIRLGVAGSPAAPVVKPNTVPATVPANVKKVK